MVVVGEPGDQAVGDRAYDRRDPYRHVPERIKLGQPGARPNGAAPEWELFDCETDPLELRNLAGDPACNDVFETMLRKLDAMMAEIGDVPEHDTAAVLTARRENAA